MYKPKRFYLVGILCKSQRITFSGGISIIGNPTKPEIEGTVKMSWADSMIGVLPVFLNKKQAQKYGKKYGGKKYKLMEVFKGENIQVEE